jgi:hypothetical protein
VASDSKNALATRLPREECSTHRRLLPPSSAWRTSRAKANTAEDPSANSDRPSHRARGPLAVRRQVWRHHGSIDECIRALYVRTGPMVKRDESRNIQSLEAERRLERVERLLRAAADEARSARINLGQGREPGERWARMMFGVLQELDGLGGEVSRRRFLDIGERHGYNHRGMAGFYQQLVEPRSGYKTRLTAAGRERLRFLQARYGDTGEPRGPETDTAP